MPLRGIGEVGPDDDLAALLVAAATSNGCPLQDGDIVVVSSKVVAKAEGRSAPAADREALLDEQTLRVVAERVTARGLTQIVRTTGGLVMAAAGIDASNVPAGTVLALPADPDASARALRTALVDRPGGPRRGGGQRHHGSGLAAGAGRRRHRHRRPAGGSRT